MEPIRKQVSLRWRPESIIDVYQLFLGVFLFVSPWLFSYARSTTRMDIWVTSLAIIAVSVAALVAFSEWEEWINVLLAIWLIAAPWVLGFTHTTAMHVSIGVGLVIGFLALLDLWLVRYYHEAGGGDAARHDAH